MSAPAAAGWRRGAVLAILLAAFLLRVHWLDHQELRGDEAFGYFFSQRDYAGMIDATIDLQEPHPVASYFVQRTWLGMAGDTEFALRFTSAWFSVLAVALLIRLALRLGYRRDPALLAALLLAISPYAIWHAQDARMYSMSLALTTATVWLGIETLQRQRVAWGLAYATVAWLALHTHYYAVFVLLALNLFVFTRAIFLPRTRANLSMWIMWQIVVGVLYLPWLASAAPILGGYSGNGDSPGFMAMVQRSISVFVAGESVPVEQRAVWAATGGLLLLVGGLRLLSGSPANRRTLWLLVLYLGAPVLATWYGAQSRPIFNERYLVASAPPFYLLAAAAFDGRRFARRPEAAMKGLCVAGLALFVAGSLFSLSQYYTQPAYSKTRGWRDLAATLERWSAGLPSDQVRIAQNFPDPTLWYYYRGPLANLVLPPAPHDEAGASAAVDALNAEGVRRVLLPVQPAPNWDDGAIAAAALAGGAYELAREQPVGVWPLRVYVRAPETLHVSTPLRVHFANGVQLLGATGLDWTAPLPPGALLTPGLIWSAPPELPGLADLKVTVQLLDGDGRLVAQQDLPFQAAQLDADNLWTRTFALDVPGELAPGAYRLIAGLYDGAAAGAPRVPTTAGEQAVELTVAPIQAGGVE